MVPSTWLRAIASSPSSLDKCRLIECRVAANPQTKPVDLGCESADNWQLLSTSTVTIYYYLLLSPKASTRFTVLQRVKS